MLSGANYPYPNRDTKLLGTIIQKYRPRSGQPTAGFQTWIDRLNGRVVSTLVPALLQARMLLEDEDYQRIGHTRAGDHNLVQIPDFNTLIATSQNVQKPVFALEDRDFGHVGQVLDQDRAKREEFRGVFNDLAEKVLTLTE